MNYAARCGAPARDVLRMNIPIKFTTSWQSGTNAIIWLLPMQSTLRPTKWVTLECTKNNSTGPHKPMNIIRNSLLAKITVEYLKWLRAYGHNYYAHHHTNSYVFANYS